MTPLSPKAAMHDLMGTICPCGAAKDRRRSFCHPCFQRLPRALRGKLAGVGKSEFITPAYPATYAAALDSLGLGSPFQAEHAPSPRVPVSPRPPFAHSSLPPQ